MNKHSLYDIDNKISKTIYPMDSNSLLSLMELYDNATDKREFVLAVCNKLVTNEMRSRFRRELNA